MTDTKDTVGAVVDPHSWEEYRNEHYDRIYKIIYNNTIGEENRVKTVLKVIMAMMTLALLWRGVDSGNAVGYMILWLLFAVPFYMYMTGNQGLTSISDVESKAKKEVHDNYMRKYHPEEFGDILSERMKHGAL